MVWSSYNFYIVTTIDTDKKKVIYFNLCQQNTASSWDTSIDAMGMVGLTKLKFIGMVTHWRFVLSFYITENKLAVGKVIQKRTRLLLKSLVHSGHILGHEGKGAIFPEKAKMQKYIRKIGSFCTILDRTLSCIWLWHLSEG